MKITDYRIQPSAADPLKGMVAIGDGTAYYNVLGPFGQGYNIRVELEGEEGTLSYHWREAPGAHAQTTSSTYEIHADAIYKGQERILHLSRKGSFEPIDDGVAVALFIVNHHFAQKTGPFEKKA